MTYSTQALIKILDDELKAIWRGDRLVLSTADRLNSPAIAKALNPHQVNKVFAFQDFRRQIHEYQAIHRVSGIVWRELRYQGQQLRVPEVHNQLIAIPGDKATLMAAKTAVLTFWREMTQTLTFWQAEPRQPLPADYVDYLCLRAEWAELDVGIQELYLGLCWGNPQEHRYRWAKPKSGCDRIIAAPGEPSSIEV